MADFITNAAGTSYVTASLGGCVAVAALAVDAPIVAVTAASIAACAFAFLTFVAWVAR